MNTRSTITVVASVAIIATAGLLVAGPLNPPAGPIASTGKTLTEVEPRVAINATNTPGDADSRFKITQPGSYYLTGNITNVVGEHGIEITASGVTIDLNGFDLTGFGSSSFDGVSATVSDLTNIAVINGSVRSWGRYGINLATFSATACRVQGVRASGNASVGIYVGTNTLVLDSTIAGGNYGIYALGGGTVTGCSVSGASTSGIFAVNGMTIFNCTARDNTGIGIDAGTGSTVSSCSAYNNTGVGIDASAGSIVSNCSAYSNSGDGISVGSGTIVEHCATSLNALDGIQCSSACLIRNNTSRSNGTGGDGAGIHATGSDNRIEENNCTGADRGIDVDVAGNIIIKNSCAGNTTNWVIAAGNAYGPIVVTTAGAAVNGNAAAAAIGSTDPNANFTF